MRDRTRVSVGIVGLWLGCGLLACGGAEEPPKSPQALADAFEDAHEDADIVALSRLVYWDRADERTRTSFEKHSSADFGLEISEVVVEPVDPEMKLEYTLDGVTYRPNLEPAGRLRVEFEPGEAGGLPTTHSTSYLFGTRDGVYWIATSAPVPTDSP